MISSPCADDIEGLLFISRVYNRAYLIETAEIVSINPLYPPIFGGLLKLEDTPISPAGSILHLFFSGL